MRNYAIGFTPPECSAESTLLYMASHLSYKPGPGFDIYTANHLQSTFVEIINPKKGNSVIGNSAIGCVIVSKYGCS